MPRSTQQQRKTESAVLTFEGDVIEMKVGELPGACHLFYFLLNIPKHQMRETQ